MTPMRVTPAERTLILRMRAEAIPEAVEVDDTNEYGKPSAKPTTRSRPFSARTDYCPICPPDKKMVRENLNAIQAKKTCPTCGRKFIYVRTDTPEGRAQRAKQWRKGKRK